MWNAGGAQRKKSLFAILLTPMTLTAACGGDGAFSPPQSAPSETPPETEEPQATPGALGTQELSAPDQPHPGVEADPRAHMLMAPSHPGATPEFWLPLWLPTGSVFLDDHGVNLCRLQKACKFRSGHQCNEQFLASYLYVAGRLIARISGY